MDRSLLDQLVVPQPPYRMARPLAGRSAPVAVLAAVDETPPKPPVIVPRENLSITQAIEDRDETLKIPENLSLVEVIEAARNEESAKLDAAPLPEGATSEEIAQDTANKEEAKFQVDVVAAEIAAEARVATAPRSEGEIRQQKFAEKSEAEKKRQVTRDQIAALKEEAARTPVAAPKPEAVVEPKPEVGSQQVRMAPTPEIEKARQATEPAGGSLGAMHAYQEAAEQFGASDPRTIKARDEYRRSRQVGSSAEAPKATEKDVQEPRVEQAPDFERVQSFDELYDAIKLLADQGGENWLDLIPSIRNIRGRAKKIPADQLSRELSVFAGNPLQAPLERLLAAERPQSEPAKKEAAPTPSEGEQRLQEENARLRAQNEELQRQAASTRGEEQAPANSPVAEILREADPLGFEQLDKSFEQSPSLWKRFWERTIWKWHDALALGAAILEKRAKDMLVERDAKIKALEEEAAAHTNKSWLGTGKVGSLPIVRTKIKPFLEGGRMIKYRARLEWHRWKREGIAAALESHAVNRRAFEDAHLGAINNVASQQEVVIALAEQRESIDEKRVAKYDTELQILEDKRRAAQEAFVNEPDFAKKKEFRNRLRQILADIDEATTIRARYADELVKSTEVAAKLRAQQNVLMKKAQQPERPMPEEHKQERLRPRAKRKVKEQVTTAA